MKYFTLQWWIDCQELDWPSEEVRMPPEQYERYYASVEDQLPREIADFELKYSLHDAVFLNMKIDIEQETVELNFLISIRTENNRRFEKQGTLLYAGVKHFGSSADIERALPGTGGHGDLGYDEIEVIATNLYEHRMLYSSGIEFAVRFSGFRYEIAA
jgi:hypothetical protein